MWHFRFFGTLLTVLALLGFMGSQRVLAAYPLASEFSMSQPQETRGIDGSFQLAVMGNSAIPLDIPTEKFPKKVKSEKPAVENPKATPKVSKPKKKKVKTAKVKKAPAKKSVTVEEEEGFLTRTLKMLVGGDEAKKSPTSKSLLQKSAGKKSEPAKKEEGLLTKTFNSLMSGDEDKKESVSKSKPQKTAKKKPEPEKKEEGLLTRTLKSLVGGDQKDKKEEKAAKKNVLNPINMAPAAGSATHKKAEESPKTAKSETKKTLKDSFEKLIGVGAVDKSAIETKPAATKQAKAEKPVEKKAAPPRPKRITARKYIENEESHLEKNRGGVEKGKNVLKESFKTLVIDSKKDDKKKALTE